MGRVFEARHLTLGNLVAVKLLFTNTMSEEHISRFRREAKMYAALAHPHLVKIYDAGVDAEYPYLILEYIRGQDLKAAVRDPERPRLAAVVQEANDKRKEES